LPTSEVGHQTPGSETAPEAEAICNYSALS